jgi:O-antigen/teichoic acid export membrane protein
MVKEMPANGPPGMNAAVVSGLGWTAALYGIQLVAQLGFTAVLARLLTPQQYGVVSAANVFIQFASLFMDLGLGAAIVQMPTLGWRQKQVAFSIVLSMSLVCFVGTLAIS